MGQLFLHGEYLTISLNWAKFFSGSYYRHRKWEIEPFLRWLNVNNCWCHCVKCEMKVPYVTFLMQFPRLLSIFLWFDKESQKFSKKWLCVVWCCATCCTLINEPGTQTASCFLVNQVFHQNEPSQNHCNEHICRNAWNKKLFSGNSYLKLRILSALQRKYSSNFAFNWSITEFTTLPFCNHNYLSKHQKGCDISWGQFMSVRFSASHHVSYFPFLPFLALIWVPLMSHGMLC
jgi:hypothetical protein